MRFSILICRRTGDIGKRQHENQPLPAERCLKTNSSTVIKIRIGFRDVGRGDSRTGNEGHKETLATEKRFRKIVLISRFSWARYEPTENIGFEIFRCVFCRWWVRLRWPRIPVSKLIDTVTLTLYDGLLSSRVGGWGIIVVMTLTRCASELRRMCVCVFLRVRLIFRGITAVVCVSYPYLFFLSILFELELLFIYPFYIFNFIGKFSSKSVLDLKEGTWAYCIKNVVFLEDH